MLFLLLAAAAPQTVIDAERAFAADAQTIGQWSAFRKWADRGAIMFTPQPTKALVWLKDRRDPTAAIRWSPIASWVACDGHSAVNTGEWRRPDGSVGYFSTIWRRRSDGQWRWQVDGGDVLAAPRPSVARPSMRIAHCGGAGRTSGYDLDFGHGGGTGYGVSNDATLRWRYHVDPDGARRFIAETWNGRAYDRVIDDRIAAPKP